MTWLGWIKTKLTKIKLLSVCQELKQDLLNELFGLKKKTYDVDKAVDLVYPLKQLSLCRVDHLGFVVPERNCSNPKASRASVFSSSFSFSSV